MMVTAPLPIGYRIGPFQLDLRSGELTRNGRRIRLQEKPKSLLLAFAERPGEVITRGELHEHLWPGDTFVDFEDGLNTAMRKLREALDDDPQAPQFIETVRGRGYRFIAVVDPVAEEIPGADPAPEKAVQEVPEAALPVAVAVAEPRRAFPWKTAVAITVVLAAAAGALVFGMHWRNAHRPVVSVAVLPLANMTGDASRNYVSNGMTEELIARLGQVSGSGLRVIAPASALAYANTNKSAQQIGHELGVQYLIQGSLQQQGANVRVAVGLVRVEDQARLWGGVYDGDLSELFEFESAIADSVGNALSVKISTTPVEQYRPGKYEAHDAYLKGLYFFSQRSKAGFEQAIENFSNAIAIDPKYAAAYAQLASAYNLMGQYSWMDPNNARSQAWAAAEQALSLDPAQAQAHEALGFSEWYYNWDPKEAEGEFRKAIELDPRNVDAHHHYEQLLMTAGRFPEAEEQMREALDLDPRSLILRTNLGWLSYFEGRNQDAIRQMQSVIDENPNFLTAHYKLWWVESVAGDESRAAQELLWVVRAMADASNNNRIEDAYRTGGYPAALREFAEIDDMNYYGNNVDGARCMVFAGDRDGALHYLELAERQHEGWMLFVPREPAFTSLHEDARFQRLVAEIKKTP